VESLKDTEAKQEGNMSSFIASGYLLFADILILVFWALTARLEAAEKALSEERAAQLAAAQSLAEEKPTWQITDQSSRSYQEANAALNWDLQSAQASITVTMEKLSSKSSALDLAVIWEREAQINLQRLGEEKKAKEQLLKSAWTALAKRDFSSLAVISSTVAHAMALVKNHMPEFDADILRRDFSINEAERETLVDSVYDTTQHFVSLYDFSALIELNDNNSPAAL
jgi:exonuclease VII large subunit